MEIVLGLFALALFLIGTATVVNSMVLLELHAAQQKILVSIVLDPSLIKPSK